MRDKKINFVDIEGTSVIESTEEVVLDMNNLDLSRIKAAIQMLPDGYKQIITLYLLEGYDHIEIGEILSVSTGTFKSQYHRAKKKYRKQTQNVGRYRKGT